MKRALPFFIIALVALATIAAGTRIYRVKHDRIAAAAAAAAKAAETAAKEPAGAKPGAKPARVRGPANAPVTIEEFGDFQCPPCAFTSTLLHEVERDPEFNGKLRLIFRHYPLDMHKHAKLAAWAAEAAGLQGKFWEMHDQLYQNRDAWSAAEDVRPFLEEYARNIGLDMERFARDRESEAVKARVAQDQERARSLQVNSTPTLFVNGKLLGNTERTPEGLRKAIGARLEGKPPPL